MAISTREEAERQLAKALSRHIGYTSGAYDLDRIFATLQPFTSRTSAYKDELVTFLGEDGDKAEAPSPEYRADILSFASAMGLIEAISAREAKLVRYAPTELGRSVLGAQSLGSPDFYRFLMSKIVLRADADFLLPMLLFYQEGSSQKQLIPYFAEFARELRSRRLEWMKSSFPERVLFERVAAQIPWLKRSKVPGNFYEIDLPSANTARHHATPRSRWIEQLQMFDRATGRLSQFGLDVVHSLVQQDTYFWLSPARDALDALGLTELPLGQAEDQLSFHRQEALPTRSEVENLVGDLKSVLIAGYNAAKLVHASQASLRLAVEYISFRSYQDARSYDWESVLEALFLENKDALQRYSARKGKIGFYRVMQS